MQTIQLGCQSYTKAQAIAIMRAPTSKDMTYQLAAHLIAAKLNINCNKSNPSCVANAIVAADNFLCAHPIGSGVRANSPEWQGIAMTFNTLVNYNEGRLCAPHRD